jgi:hypothetical protein
LANNKKYDIGTFDTPSLLELKNELNKYPKNKNLGSLKFENIAGDIQ